MSHYDATERYILAEADGKFDSHLSAVLLVLWQIRYVEIAVFKGLVMV